MFRALNNILHHPSFTITMARACREKATHPVALRNKNVSASVVGNLLSSLNLREVPESWSKEVLRSLDQFEKINGGQRNSGKGILKQRAVDDGCVGGLPADSGRTADFQGVQGN